MPTPLSPAGADTGRDRKGIVVRELPDRPNLDHYRREAKELVRAYARGDAAALGRIGAVLPDRGRFVLADAQHVVACEHGFRNWGDFRRSVEEPPLTALMRTEVGEVVVDSGLVYGDGEPVRIQVRKRFHRYDLSDRGRAVQKAGKPELWREAAEPAVLPMNVDRSGHVFVGAVEGRDIESLVVRLADASRAVHEALLVLDD